jgi:hypothetical protein
MRETLNLPEDDQFMTITKDDSANFRYDNAFGMTQSDHLVYIEITAFETRTLEQEDAVSTDCIRGTFRDRSHRR